MNLQMAKAAELDKLAMCIPDLVADPLKSVPCMSSPTLADQLHMDVGLFALTFLT
jgi:hypothetical protein